MGERVQRVAQRRRVQMELRGRRTGEPAPVPGQLGRLERALQPTRPAALGPLRPTARRRMASAAVLEIRARRMPRFASFSS